MYVSYISFEIVGIVNGLVCSISNNNNNGDNDLCLWNPVLRVSKHLPISTNYAGIFKPSRVVYGFGYDVSNDDYKIIKLHVGHRSGYVGYANTTKVEIYSLRADIWKRINDLKDVVLYFNGAYANGKILWIAGRMSFDMMSDEYEEIEGPVNAFHVSGLRITVLDGRIYVVSCCNYRVKTDLWVMDKFGADESWSKVFFPCDDGSVPLVIKPSYRIKKVVCITRDREIVLQD